MHNCEQAVVFHDSIPHDAIGTIASTGCALTERYPHLFRADAISDTKAQLSLWDQLSDIWHILAGGGLVMSDVLKNEAARRVLEDAAGEEVSRWRELAALEKRFLEDLLRFYNNSANANFFKDLDFYLMRNSSHKSRGLGFAQAGNFNPDFLIWWGNGDEP